MRWAFLFAASLKQYATAAAAAAAAAADRLGTFLLSLQALLELCLDMRVVAVRYPFFLSGFVSFSCLQYFHTRSPSMVYRLNLSTISSAIGPSFLLPGAFFLFSVCFFCSS